MASATAKQSTMPDVQTGVEVQRIEQFRMDFSNLPPVPKSLANFMRSALPPSLTPTSSPRGTPSREGTPTRRPPPALPPVFCFDDVIQQMANVSVNGGSENGLAGPSVPPRRNSMMEQQLSTLKKEMARLRQIDMQVLCHLWSVNERIQELRQSFSDANYSNLSDSDYYNSFEFDENDETDCEDNVYDEATSSEQEVVVHDGSLFNIRTATLKQTSL